MKEKDGVIEHLFQQIEQMKISFHYLIERSDSNAKGNTTGLLLGPACVGQVPIVDDDRAYFSTYSHYDIHHDMLSVSDT